MSSQMVPVKAQLAQPVVAEHGPVSAGPLVGPQQTILRAEVAEVLSALLWASTSIGDLHISISGVTTKPLLII